MSTEDLQAQALAEWLAAHPGSEPPADVDPDVIEAVYMLRPDLAPAPRVSVDDILSGMDPALFAPVGEVAADTLVQPVSEVVAAPEVPKPANRRRMWGVVGSVAAVAAVFLVVSQVALYGLNGASEPMMDASEPMAVAPGGDAGAPMRQEEAQAEPERSARGVAAAPAPRPAATARPAPMAGEAAVIEEPLFDAVADNGDLDGELDGVLTRGVADREEQVAQSVATTGSAGLIVGGAEGAGNREVDDEVFDAVADLDDLDAPENTFDLGDEREDEEQELRTESDDVLGGVVGSDLAADVPASVTTASAPPPPPPPAAAPQEDYAETVAVERERRPLFGGGGGRRQSSAPAMEEAPMEMAPEPEAEPDSAEAARARAGRLAASQLYSQAFATLAPYVSPSAPMALIVDAAEYAFAAGQWRDVVSVTRTRLDNRMASDSAQDRAHLFDLQARAQAMMTPLDEPAMRMDSVDE